MALRARSLPADQTLATGRTEGKRDPGALGNERLTAMAGAVLFVLLAAEGVTILQVRQLFTLHAFIGVMLVGPLSVKLGSTGYRFFRYYSGSPGYRKKGPPQPLLRALAPVLVVSTLAVVGTGMALLIVGPAARGALIEWHKASFYVWFAVTTVHVVFYIWRVPGLLREEWTKPHRPRLAGAQKRLAIAGAGIGAGVVAGIVALPAIATWSSWFSNFRR